MAKKELTVVMRARNAMAAGLAKAQRSLQKFGQSAKRIGGLFAKAFAVAGGAVATAGAIFLKAGANAQEMRSKFAAVFKEAAPGAEKFAEDLGKATNRGKNELMGFMSSLQDIFVPMGIGRGEAQKLSGEMTKLALDVASFNNVSDAKVLEDFKSAMTGSNEVLKKYGVVITEASIKSEAYASGIAKEGDALTEAQKVQARYQLLLKGTRDAQGDAERTAGSLTNQWKGLRGAINDANATIGEAILDNSAIADIVGKVREKVSALTAAFRDWTSKGGIEEATMTAKLFGLEFVSSLKSIGEYAKGFYNIVNASLIEPVKRYYDMIMNAVVPAGMAFGKLLKGEFSEAGRMAKEAVDNAKKSVKGLFDADNYKSYFKGVTDAWDDTGKAIEKIEQDKANKIDAINKKYVADEKARREKHAADEKNSESGKNALIGKGVDELREKRKQAIIDATKAAKQAALEAAKADLDSIAERKRAAEDLARTRVQALIDERRQQKKISKDMADEDKHARGLIAKQATGRMKRLSKKDREFLDAWKTINRAKDDASALGRSEAAKAGEVKKYEDQLNRLDKIAEKLQDIKDQNNELLRMG